MFIWNLQFLRIYLIKVSCYRIAITMKLNRTLLCIGTHLFWITSPNPLQLDKKKESEKDPQIKSVLLSNNCLYISRVQSEKHGPNLSWLWLLTMAINETWNPTKQMQWLFSKWLHTSSKFFKPNHTLTHLKRVRFGMSKYENLTFFLLHSGHC